LSEPKVEQEGKPAPAPSPASAPPPAPAAAKPAAPPPKVEAPSLPPSEMISAELKAFLHEKLQSGEDVTIEVGKQIFTGRIFRTLIEEGWIALEHVDGRRQAFFLITGGKVRSQSGQEFTLPGAHGK
jgi:hypothetical protein